MRRILPTLSLTAPLLGAGLIFLSCSPSTPLQSPQPTSVGKNAFATSVKPLFEHRCVWCHNNDVSHAGLNLQERDTVLDPKRAFIVPGDPGKSSIYLAVTRSFKHPRVMPGDGWGISQEHRDALKQWITDGAPWPDGRKGRITRKSYQVDLDDL